MPAGAEQDENREQREGSMHHSRFERVKWSVLAGLCLGCRGAAPAPRPQPAPVRPGIDVLLSDSLALVRGKRIGFVTNGAAVDANGVIAINELRGAGLHL